MHLYKKNSKTGVASIFVTVIIFVIVLSFFYSQIGKVSDEMEESDVKILEDALNNAIVTCYAIEGVYPESIEYIVDKYGVIYDDKKFFISYEKDLVNVKPKVTVIRIDEAE